MRWKKSISFQAITALYKIKKQEDIMKKIISIISIIAITITFTSCSNNNDISKNNSTVKNTIKETEAEEKKIYIQYNGHLEWI